MLTSTQNSLIIGFLLGDAHMEQNGKNCRLRFKHGILQKPYVEWKCHKLKPWSLCLRQEDRYDKRTKKVYPGCGFDTRTLPIFNGLNSLFYEQRQKRVPQNIRNLILDPLTLAVWYLDDGALRVDSKAFRLHTNDFIWSDVERLQQTLLSNFNVVAAIHRQQNKLPGWDETGQDLLEKFSPKGAKNARADEKGFLLHIGAQDGQAQRFSDLIKPIVASQVPSMLYKFF